MVEAEISRKMGMPYRAEYIEKYGATAQIDVGWDPDPSWSESIYKEALDKGVRWEEIYTPPDRELPEGYVL